MRGRAPVGTVSDSADIGCTTVFTNTYKAAGTNTDMGTDAGESSDAGGVFLAWHTKRIRSVVPLMRRIANK